MNSEDFFQSSSCKGSHWSLTGCSHLQHGSHQDTEVAADLGSSGDCTLAPGKTELARQKTVVCCRMHTRWQTLISYLVICRQRELQATINSPFTGSPLKTLGVVLTLEKSCWPKVLFYSSWLAFGGVKAHCLKAKGCAWSITRETKQLSQL